MNTDPADTRSSHLDLDDLLAEANGVSIGDAAREHLAGCDRCRREADRWNLVADGVRSLAATAATSEAEAEAEAEAGSAARPALPGWPSHPGRTGLRIPSGARRRALLAGGSAAAALLVLVGVGTAADLVHVRLSLPGGSSSSDAILTAVSGCATLEQGSGTLERVDGSSLVVKAAGGQSVTVTTTAATQVSDAGAPLGDITDGAPVTVWGPSSDGTVAAFFVIIGNPAQQHPQPPAGLVVVKGTVADATTAGFTVVTSDGSRVPVTTSGVTAVSVLNASVSRLPVGASILALGYAGPNGTLSARGVVAISQLPSSGPQLNGQEHITTTRRVHVQDCSPASIEHAILLVAGG